MLLYDVTNPATFDNVLNWINIVNDLNKTRSNLFLLGNKIDLTDNKLEDYSSKIR